MLLGYEHSKHHEAVETGNSTAYSRKRDSRGRWNLIICETEMDMLISHIPDPKDHQKRKKEIENKKEMHA